MDRTYQIVIAVIMPFLVGCGGGSSGSGGSGSGSGGSGSGSGGSNNVGIIDPIIDLNISPDFNVDDDSSYQLQKTDLHIDRRYGINSSPCNCFYHAVVYTDLDNDGDTDVFMSGGNGTEDRSPIEIHINDGSGNFTLDNTLLVGTEPGAIHPRKALLGDFNNDGKLDIFVAGHGYDNPPFPGEHPLLFLTTTNGLEYNSSLESYSGFHHSAASADIDNDGDLDIFVGDPTTSFFLINDGNGNFSPSTERLTSEMNGKSLFTSELIDIDEDGYIDLVIAGHEFEETDTTIYWGSSTGTYLSRNKTVLPAVTNLGVVLDIDSEDINNDGIKDIVLTRTRSDFFYVGYYIQLIQQTGTRQFSDATSNISLNSSLNAGEWIDWIRIQDYNADGHLDIIEDNNNTRGLVWLNDGSGLFAP